MRTKTEIMNDYETLGNELVALKDGASLNETYEAFNTYRLGYEKITLQLQCLESELQIVNRIAIEGAL